MYLCDFIVRQKQWSEKTFGPGLRTEGILKHIESEISEVRENPTDPMEWIDIAILALDGAWRCAGARGAFNALLDKQKINFGREYQKPESEDDPAFHIEAGEG